MRSPFRSVAHATSFGVQDYSYTERFHPAEGALIFGCARLPIVRREESPGRRLLAMKQADRCASGIPGLDEVLNGGLIAQRMYLVDGNPGAGKTTLALQFLLEGARLGERCLYVTLSETALELRAVAASHGWSLDGVEIVELIVDEGALHGDAQLTMLHASEVELTETTRKLINALNELNPTRLVIDSLSELRLLSQSSLRYRRQILALKQLFLGRTCTVIMLDDRTAEGPDLQLHSIAHGV